MANVSPGFQAGLLSAANLTLFLGFARLIERYNIHHHWILVWIPTALLLELALLEWQKAPTLLRHNLFWTAGLCALIGAGRFQTIFACFDACYYKLSAMYLLTAVLLAAPFLAWKAASEKRAAQAALLFLIGVLWALSRGFSSLPGALP